MNHPRHCYARIALAAGVAVLAAGCQLSGFGNSAGGQPAGPAETITQAVAPAALLAVVSGPSAGPALSGLVASTAQASESLRILQAGRPARTIVAGDSPGPARAVIAGPPAAPTGGQTSFEKAQYAKKLKAWQSARSAAQRVNAAQTRERVANWLRGLSVPQRLGRLPAAPGSLAAESAVAASALAGLRQEAGDSFGPRRVMVLFPASLGGALPAGELNGDDVIVVTGYLPTAAEASAAQAELLTAGAAEAAVVGPEVTASQLSALVTAGLSQGGAGGSVSEPVLFGNGSAALDTAARGRLTRLLPRLGQAGSTAVVNGYASNAGQAQANYLLSYRRASAVAAFLEAHGIPASSLIIVGHGATGAFGDGSPAANRRVLVVTERAAVTA